MTLAHGSMIAALLSLAACNERSPNRDDGSVVTSRVSPKTEKSGTTTLSAPSSARAAVRVLQQAIAFVQTDRVEQIGPLLTPKATVQFDRAGGRKLIDEYKSAQIQLRIPAADARAKSSLDVPFALYRSKKGGDEMREGVATMRRDPATGTPAWRIDNVVLGPPQVVAKFGG